MYTHTHTYHAYYISYFVGGSAALREWYGKFPEFLENKLFVSGESYGGIYVPYMAW